MVGPSALRMSSRETIFVCDCVCGRPPDGACMVEGAAKDCLQARHEPFIAQRTPRPKVTPKRGKGATLLSFRLSEPAAGAQGGLQAQTRRRPPCPCRPRRLGPCVPCRQGTFSAYPVQQKKSNVLYSCQRFRTQAAGCRLQAVGTAKEGAGGGEGAGGRERPFDRRAAGQADSSALAVDSPGPLGRGSPRHAPIFRVCPPWRTCEGRRWA